MMVKKSPCDRIDIEVRFITFLLQYKVINYDKYESLGFVIIYFTYVGAT